MDARPALPLVLLVLAGCTGTSAADDGFRVTFAFPADGVESYPETPVRIGFSAPIDPTTCDADTIVLAALRDDASVAWTVPYTWQPLTDQDGFELVHDDLAAGLLHSLTVQSGEDGCLSSDGEAIEPFAITFPVVER